MTDTPRTLSAVQALLADNTSQDISAQDARDAVLSAVYWDRQGRASILAAPGGTYDDEFLGTSISGSYNEVIPSGTNPGSFKQAYGRMHYKKTAVGTANYLSALMKAPASISVGDYIEARLRCRLAVADHWQAVCLVMADGHTLGAGAQVCASWYANGAANSQGFARLESTSNYGTTWNESATVWNNYNQRDVYMRLKYQSSNTWGLYVSDDGMTFYSVQTNYSKTLTPTEIGIGVRHFNESEAAQAWISWDYLRLNPADE